MDKQWDWWQYAHANASMMKLRLHMHTAPQYSALRWEGKATTSGPKGCSHAKKDTEDDFSQWIASWPMM